MPDPKLSFALRAGQIVHISTVGSGKHTDCVCPLCHKILVAKKGSVQQPHFAHYQGTTCSLESIMHSVGKTLIYQGIKKAIAENRPLPLRWQCEECGDFHTGNLLKKALDAKLEQSVGSARPDVLLTGATGTPIVAIEVVVTHSPEPAAMQFYRDNKIDVLIVHLRSDAVVESLRELKELRAALGTVCTRKKCPDCQQRLMPSPLYVVTDTCYQCKAPMKIAFKLTSEGWDSPEDFSPDEVRHAKTAGCCLQVRYSKTMNSRYLANVCRRCNGFIGNFYMFKYVNLADTSARRHDQTYCPRCEKHFDDEPP